MYSSTQSTILFFVLLLLSALTSCLDPMSRQPTILIDNLAEGDSVPTGEFFSFGLEVEKGRRPMKSLSFLESGSPIEGSDRIFINGEVVNSLPVLLEGDEKEELDWVVNIEAAAEEGLFTYTLFVTDENGEITEKSFQLNTFDRQLAPSLSVSTQTSNIDPQEDFLISIFSLKGTSNLNSFETQENNQLIEDLGRLQIGGSPIASNPLILAEKDSAELSTVLRITAPSASGAFTYTFIIKDDNGLSRILSLPIQVN